MKKKKSRTHYLDSFKEYQDKQYLPGYYTGGKIHPMYQAQTKAGAYWILFGVFLFLISLMITFVVDKKAFTREDLLPLVAFVIFYGNVLVLSIIAAIKILKNQKAKK